MLPLQALLFPVTDCLSLLGRTRCREVLDSYKGLMFLRTPLKAGFTLTLSLALLLAVLAVSGSLYTARRLVQLLRHLAAGTGGGRRAV